MDSMKILLTGGGTMGSVTPLLAIKDALQQSGDYEFLWVGTSFGPERKIVEQNKIPFRSIPSGKLRRYFSWRNFTDIFLIFFGFIKSLWIILRFQPQLILTAGSFVSVPLVLAAAIFHRKIVIHQQDLKVGLANRLMQPFAMKITVAFEELRDFFPSPKVVITGNPVRLTLFDGDRERALKKFNLQPNLPVLVVMGGGLGSEIINQTFIKISKELTKFCQVIHLLGRGNQVKWLYDSEIATNNRYHAYEFLDQDLADAYAIADLVFCRAGFSTLTEVSALKKPAVVMPIPDHQQVKNAEYFYNKKAIVYVRQEDFGDDYLLNLLEDLLSRSSRLKELSDNIYYALPQKATEQYADFIRHLLGQY